MNSWYESIAPGDEPPFSLQGMKSIVEPVRKGQERLHVTGAMYIVATVEPNGTVSVVKAYTSPSPAMAQFVDKVFVVTKFKPAVCGGRLGRMEFPPSFKFQLCEDC